MRYYPIELASQGAIRYSKNIELQNKIIIHYYNSRKPSKPVHFFLKNYSDLPFLPGPILGLAHRGD